MSNLMNPLLDYADHDMSFLTRFALYGNWRSRFWILHWLRLALDNLVKLKMPIPWWLDASLERAFAFLAREKRALFHTVYAVIRQVIGTSFWVRNRFTLWKVNTETIAPLETNKRYSNKRASPLSSLFPLPSFQNISDIVNEARSSLLLWPLSQIDWPFQNIYRTDVIYFSSSRCFRSTNNSLIV